MKLQTQNVHIMFVLLLLGILTFPIAYSFAGSDQQIVIGEKVTFKSEILEEEREIEVYLPDGYGFSGINYPVLYLLDGRTHFHHASGITQFLSAAGQMPGMIVIAVTNVDRSRDFSPTHVDRIPTSGGGEKFLKFMEKELIPFVDRNYRTSSFRILMGHSFGGTFATYTLLTNPDLFRGYIAVSPYLMFDDDLLVKMADEKLKSKYNGVSFFMTLGDEPAYVETLNKFRATVDKKSPVGLDLTYTTYPNENHSSVPHLSIYDGVKSIFAGWKLPQETIDKGLPAIDKHYAELSEEFDYPVKTPEALINQLGYAHMNKGDMNGAISIFKENAERFPASPNVYDSLGEAYEKNDQQQEAVKNYEKAVELAEKSQHFNLKIYKTNLARARELVSAK